MGAQGSRTACDLIVIPRSLAACEGTVLLVDAAQGIEAQTLANLYLAMENDLTIVPVLNKIDHTLAPAAPVAEGVTVEHGAYVAAMCVGCHGAQLAGGKIPGAPPNWPAAADLRPGPQSALARYPDAETLIRMFQSGQRPDGTKIEVMPFEALRVMSETDARALHLYLKSRA